ncbi:MAG: hypothetical protein U0R80_13850 [Nocardioidaceae bacterium]
MNRYECSDGASLWLPAAAPEADAGEPDPHWVEAMRRLNRIQDPFARQVLALHHECGTGRGVCDAGLPPVEPHVTWGCETTALIAHQFGVAFPVGGLGGDASLTA